MRSRLSRALALAALLASLSLPASPAFAGGGCGTTATYRTATDEITFYAPPGNGGPTKYVQMWISAENVQVHVPDAKVHDASTWDYPNKPDRVKLTMERINTTEPGDVFISVWDECGTATQVSFELGRVYEGLAPYEVPDPRPIPANIPPLRLASCRVEFDRLPDNSAVLISAGEHTTFSQIWTDSDNFNTTVAGAKVDGTIPVNYAVWNFDQQRSLALVYTDRINSNGPARTSITVIDSCGQSHRFETGTGKAA